MAELPNDNPTEEKKADDAAAERIANAIADHVKQLHPKPGLARMMAGDGDQLIQVILTIVSIVLGLVFRNRD